MFKTWSPLATGVYLNLYLDGEGKSRLESLPMERLDHGVWYVEILRDLDGVFIPIHLSSITKQDMKP